MTRADGLRMRNYDYELGSTCTIARTAGEKEEEESVDTGWESAKTGEGMASPVRGPEMRRLVVSKKMFRRRGGVSGAYSFHAQRSDIACSSSSSVRKGSEGRGSQPTARSSPSFYERTKTNSPSQDHAKRQEHRATATKSQEKHPKDKIFTINLPPNNSPKNARLKKVPPSRPCSLKTSIKPRSYA